MPPMVVFPKFSEFYGRWKEDLKSRGVNVRLSTEVTRVVKRDKTGATVKLIKRTPVPDNHNPNSEWFAAFSAAERKRYEEIVKSAGLQKQ
ncbi:MAG: hypothetical protein M1823_006575 [Watsoniomyces obsoletus]|nr:MAG: hypothetical protein M1823_006575 [Watsoniomyces obsoletus]